MAPQSWGPRPLPGLEWSADLEPPLTGRRGLTPLRKGIATLLKVCTVNCPFALFQKNLQPFARVFVLPGKKEPMFLGITGHEL